MDIQIQSTPPKRARPCDDYSTPPKKLTHLGGYCTPEKSTPIRGIECTPVKIDSTPQRGENPQSKKLKSMGSYKKKTPGSSNRKVGEFSLSRLDMDYIYERALGKGNFSSVGLYRSRMTGDLFAIKATKASSMSVNEAQALGTLSIFNQKTKNIVRYYHSWVENSELYMVMEYCTHNLDSLYNRHREEGRRIEESELKDFLKQALQGLKSMHENKMAHLDIKPDNLLFKDSVLKISDLGLTRVAKLKNDGDIQEGDSRYLAKELLNYHSGIDITKADIYSLGMTIYEGLCLDLLPNNGPQWIEWRDNGLFLKDRMDLQDYSQELLQIIQKMVRPDWNQRPSAGEILQGSYFRESLNKRSRRMLVTNNSRRERKAESSL